MIFLFIFSLNVLNNPVACKDGHVFCKECVTTATMMSLGHCPYGRASLGMAPEATPVLAIKAIIEGKAIKCPTSLQGNPECCWEGTISMIDDHKRTFAM